MIPVTICPPSPQLEKYDEHQFYKSYVKPVSKESRIDWSDFERMGVQSSTVPQRYSGNVPAFASNMEQLRAVIVEHERRSIPSYFDVASHEATEHRKNVARAGSYRALLSAIVYRCWLERMDSVAVATMMDIKPTTVRQILFRLRNVARDLGFETVPKKKQPPIEDPRHRLEQRRRTIRRRLYGKPDYREGFHCYDCRVARVDTATNKWRCKRCNEWNNRVARKRSSKARLRNFFLERHKRIHVKKRMPRPSCPLCNPPALESPSPHMML